MSHLSINLGQCFPNFSVYKILLALINWWSLYETTYKRKMQDYIRHSIQTRKITKLKSFFQQSILDY